MNVDTSALPLTSPLLADLYQFTMLQAYFDRRMTQCRRAPSFSATSPFYMCGPRCAFRDNCDAHGARPPTGLAGYLRDCGIEDVYVCGLAREYCVRASARGAAEVGFRTSVILDLTEPVTGHDEAVRTAFVRAGVELLDSAEIVSRCAAHRLPR